MQFTHLGNTVVVVEEFKVNLVLIVAELGLPTTVD
jgi:hypothetical protein